MAEQGNNGFYRSTWRCGRALIVPASCEVRTGHHRKAHLRPQAMEVLRLLAASYPEVVRRAELIDQIWGGNHLVGDPGLTREVCLLRDALADDPKSPRLIKTFPRKGYALLQPLEAVDNRPRVWRWAALAAGLAAIIMTLALARPWAVQQDELLQSALSRANYLLERGGEAELENAERLLRHELKQHPGQPALLGTLALVMVERSGSAGSWHEARALAELAIQYSPDQPESLLLLARAALFRDWDWEVSRFWIDGALASAPDDPRVHLMESAWAASLGRFDLSLEAGHRARALDPVSPHVIGDMAWFAYSASRLTEAEDYARAALELRPDNRVAKSVLAKTLMASGRAAEGCAVLQDMTTAPLPIDPENENACVTAYLTEVRSQWQSSAPSAVRAMVLASIASELGEREEAFRLLQEAVDMHSMYVPFLAVDPDFAALHGDPRWNRLLRAVGHPLVQPDSYLASQP